jgi:hypothetical protein
MATSDARTISFLTIDVSPSKKLKHDAFRTDALSHHRDPTNSMATLHTRKTGASNT